MTRSYKQIQDQIHALQAEAEKLRQTELSDARTKVLAIMQEYGIKPEELTASSGRGGRGVRGPKGLKVQTQGKTQTKRQRAPSQPKYRNPENDAQTWTGMGRMPNWAKGKNLDELRIS